MKSITILFALAVFFISGCDRSAKDAAGDELYLHWFTIGNKQEFIPLQSSEVHLGQEIKSEGLKGKVLRDSKGLHATLEGYEKSEEQTDLGSTSSSDSTGRIGLGILPNGMVVAASHSEYDALHDIALILSTKGKSGFFHLGSTGDYYEYSLFEEGRTIEHRASEGDADDLGMTCVDPDDDSGLFDEEEGMRSVELGEDGLLDLFIRTVGHSDWSWERDLVMHYYSPARSNEDTNGD